MQDYKDKKEDISEIKSSLKKDISNSKDELLLVKKHIVISTIFFIIFSFVFVMNIFAKNELSHFTSYILLTNIVVCFFIYTKILKLFFKHSNIEVKIEALKLLINSK